MAKNIRFENVIGQHEAKARLDFFLNGHDNTRPHVMENLFFTGAKGDGKTLLAKETAKQLVVYGADGKPLMKEDGKTPKKKTWKELSGTAIGGLSEFIHGVMLTNVVDKDVTLFIDEAHNLPNKVQEALLTMTNPNPTNRNSYPFEGMNVDLDFSRQTIFLASSESHRVIPTLRDRFERIDVRPYTTEELGQIVEISAPEIQYKDGIIESIASVVRTNGRSAMKMANRIKAYLCGATEFGAKDWRKMVQVFRIRPLGLSQIEVNILRFMEERPEGCSLTNLAARSGLTREAVQRDYENYLQTHGLMEVAQGKGRVLTAKGQKYLKDLPAYDEKMGIA